MLRITEISLSMKAVAKLFLVVFVGLFIIASWHSKGATLQLTRTIVIPLDLSPSDILRSSDGNYVVAGSLLDLKRNIRLAATVIKLAPSGEVLWQYSSPLGDPRIAPRAAQSYKNSIEMNDGSIFLTGELFNVPEMGVNTSAMLLTHLSATGQLISEKTFRLTSSSFQHTEEIALWQSKPVVFGGFYDGASGANLWLFDTDGNLVDKKEIGPLEGRFRHVISNGYIYLLSGDDRRDSKHDRISEPGKLRVTRVSSNGEVTTEGTIPGFLGAGGLIAKPTHPSTDSIIHAIGFDKPVGLYTNNSADLVIVTFDSNLQEIRRDPINAPLTHMTFDYVFSQPNGHLFYFGGIPEPGFGGGSHIGVAFTDADFRQESKLDLLPDDFDYCSHVAAATPTGEPNHFVTANRLTLKNFYKKSGAIDTDIQNKYPPSTAPGGYLVVQFVELKE